MLANYRRQLLQSSPTPLPMPAILPASSYRLDPSDGQSEEIRDVRVEVNGRQLAPGRSTGLLWFLTFFAAKLLRLVCCVVGRGVAVWRTMPLVAPSG